MSHKDTEGGLLSSINEPADLKKLSLRQLKALASEIRAFLIETVSQTGGHLAPNLGVVELTLALHYVFDSPTDSFIWDVGHQCYVHKILTGRRGFFSTLRQKGGICGFPTPEESPHDAFHAGHASTSLSVGAGFAHSKRLSGDNSATVAIIGDGAFTGGMVYEAINDIAWRNLPLITILNDNNMSISENVGGIARHLERLRTHHLYLHTKKEIARSLEKIPFGSWIAGLIYRFKFALKRPLMRRSSIFDSLGVKYIGPVDGHDLDTLVSIFRHVKNRRPPLLIHLLTIKGKGYEKSEQNPIAFHGISGQDDSIAVPGKSFSSAFGESLCALGAKDARIVAFTAAMREGTGLAAFARTFPSRFVDTGIAEAHAVGAAAGLAARGYRPVVAIYSTFLQRAYDQCIHDVGIGNLPVIFALDRAGLVPADGKTHQGIFDLAYLRAVPHFTIFAPINGEELEMALRFALTLEGPFALRYPKCPVPSLPIGLPPIVLGEGFFLREGAQGVIAFLGAPLDGLFHGDWKGWALYHLRFAKPIAQKTVEELAAFDKIILVEEGIENGGLASSLRQKLLQKNPSAKVFCKTVPDTFPPVGSREELLELYGFYPLSVEGLHD